MGVPEWDRINTDKDHVIDFISLRIFILSFAVDGQGMGGSGGYYNQYPGSNSFYGGYNSGGGGYNNRPSYSASYWSPQSGSGYFWNSAQGNRVNVVTILLSSLISVFLYSIFA